MNHHPTAMFSECCVLPKNLKAKSKKLLDILINFINILPALFIKFHHRGTKPVLSLPKGHREKKNYKESVFKTKFLKSKLITLTYVQYLQYNQTSVPLCLCGS